MERKGVYNKGRQGHARNARNAHGSLFPHQAFKKFRLPFVAVLAFMFVFGVAPMMGDKLETSVVTYDAAITTSASALSDAAVVLCKGELTRVTDQLKTAEETLQVFEQNHAADFAGASLEARAYRLSEAVAALTAFVESCKVR